MNFMPMDVVRGGARDPTDASQLLCVFSPFKGRRVDSLTQLTVQLQASASNSVLPVDRRPKPQMIC